MSSHPKASKTDVVTDFRRSQILDAARDSFAKVGLARTTVDDIARRAGVAKGTVYLYYKSKEAILRQMLENDLQQLRDDTVPIVSGPGDVAGKIRRFLAAALAMFESRRDFFEHVHLEMGPDVRRKALQQGELVFKAQVAAWETALRDASVSGEVGDIDPATSARLIVGLASGLAKQRCQGWSTGSLDDLAAGMSEILWKGLSAR